MNNKTLSLLLITLSAMLLASASSASEKYKEVKRTYTTAPPAPASQTEVSVNNKSAGCISCHTASDAKNMHVSESVKLGCTDCHGGGAKVMLPLSENLQQGSKPYTALMEKAHVLPRFPEAWPNSRNPERTYTLLNKESPEFVRFINPSDLRIADEACGACHQAIVEASKRSMHSTGTML